MKKVVLNISESIYERLRFEAIYEKKDMPHLLHDRLLFKPFHKEVETAYDRWMSSEIEKILQEQI